MEEITKAYKKIDNPNMPVYGKIIAWLQINLTTTENEVRGRELSPLLQNLLNTIKNKEEYTPTHFVGYMNKYILSIFDICFKDEKQFQEVEMLKKQLKEQLDAFKKGKDYDPECIIH